MHRRNLLKTFPAAALISATAGLIPLRVQARAGGAQVTAAQRFRVGEMTVTALSDGFLNLPVEFLQGIDAGGAASLIAGAHLDPVDLRAAVNAYLVETDRETWLIDAGTGPVFGPTLGDLPDVLAVLGVDRGAVTKLIVTHLHGDHIGGATADGAPLFPNAELIVTAADRDFWTNDDIRAQAPEMFRSAFDLAKATIAAYGDRVRFISGEADVAPGIVARPLPGHTPGHTGYMLGSDGESLFVWADIIHVPAVQLVRPEVTIVADVDAGLAASTRRDLMESLAGSGQMIAGMHMNFPGVGYLDNLGDGFTFVSAPWQYF